jgi:hypothetical protein
MGAMVITVDVAAKALGIEPSAVWRLIRQRQLTQYWLDDLQRTGVDALEVIAL